MKSKKLLKFGKLLRRVLLLLQSLSSWGAVCFKCGDGRSVWRDGSWVCPNCDLV